jgi:threonine/homoserine/homoserine lactone efflux protein
MLPAALAPLISDGPIILLVLLVLSQLPPWWVPVLNIVGGLFVLYLAWGVYQSWRQYEEKAQPRDPDFSTQSLLKAALTNLMSPGPYLFWSLVTGPILLRGWRHTPSRGLAFLGGFYSAMVLSLAVLIIVFGTARKLGPTINRALLGLSALALFGFGLWQLCQGLL